ncbi:MULTISPECIES: response regulator transcription factor [unclassified Chelatococcus]|uniref:response regulator n=1 Tax=unclassified Chelatococcus TaxID=2638111 RepID=UPI001BCD8A17|nr:response regulator transcription factor [Chelatococcus sp.]MBS7739067.1 response regulator transcription factor [Chelatococcus sp. HY11]CAH1671525.1 Transcriptional regulatory protein AruR [Hyphomicrobiales bacterium]MBX3543502.1 response regulator transcription factor [Chelatococcus sp.]MCO5076403.1 response regulator transcription factor [Chelatococcus sp.]CAH1676270.1 Transcriptional regulatory protein AruR [Hyphomicrobiales bacterium]
MADIIVVDDDPSLRAMLEDGLSLAGHTIRTAGDAPALEKLLARPAPELVVLDVGLPGEDGFSIARRLRLSHGFGIIMLTGADDLIDKITGLEAGADDYMTKPFSLRELSARMDAVLRRRRVLDAEILPFGVFSLDLKNWRLLDANGIELPLFPTEIDLIAAFAMNVGRMLSRDEILRLAPAHGEDPMDRSIDTRITRLRRKLKSANHDCDLIQTSRGKGYMYRGPSRAIQLTATTQRAVPRQPPSLSQSLREAAGNSLTI